ncbi:hypothetical protein ACWDV7_33680 [Streptomyces sp. NPDC003362]
MLCNGSYTLTPLGHDAREALRSVTEWSQRWAAELADAPPTAAEGAGDRRRNRFWQRAARGTPQIFGP